METRVKRSRLRSAQICEGDIMYGDSDSAPGTKSVYKTMEKAVKARQHPSENGLEVIDFRRIADFPVVIERGRMSFRGDEKIVYGFTEMEDLMVIVNVLPVWLQIEATHFALENCPQFPNSTNLGPHQASGIWERNGHLLNGDASLREQMQAVKSSELGRLRWSALGYQYDWTARRYPQTQSEDITAVSDGEDIPQTFPAQLSAVVKEIVAGLLVPGVSIEPEAAIVNYYLPGNSMGGHIDDAELTYDHPVVSLSIGRPCTFLVGSCGNEDQKPLGMLLRSGDCLLLCGKSRLRMHGVARVYDCPYAEQRKGSRKVTPVSACTDTCRSLCRSGCDLQQMLDADGNSGADDSSRNQDVYHADMAGVTCPRYSGTIGKRKLPSMGSHAAASERDSAVATGIVSISDDINIGECTHKSRVNVDITDVTDPVCSCCGRPLLKGAEVDRVKTYLKMARVNINSRQVYPSKK